MVFNTSHPRDQLVAVASEQLAALIVARSIHIASGASISNLPSDDDLMDDAEMFARALVGRICRDRVAGGQQ